jgi:hypothetical protein
MKEVPVVHYIDVSKAELITITSDRTIERVSVERNGHEFSQGAAFCDCGGSMWLAGGIDGRTSVATDAVYEIAYDDPVV